MRTTLRPLHVPGDFEPIGVEDDVILWISLDFTDRGPP